jgi:GDP-L-fucose synthase
MKLLVTGGNGYLGKSISASVKEVGEVVITTRKDFDLSDSRQTIKWFEGKWFDVVIHNAFVGGSRTTEDNYEVLDANLRMHYNLLSNKNHFARLITFGSGAEIFSPDSPYGLSKRVITESIRNTADWYNLRIFGVFDENELNTRFIKANISRYLMREPMIVHQNKVMDFFYMKDLITLVKYYITAASPPKETNCSYDEKQTLLNIANKINSLDSHSVRVIDLSDAPLQFYCGNPNKVSIPMIGLDQGIQEVYNCLRDLHYRQYTV